MARRKRDVVYVDARSTDVFETDDNLIPFADRIEADMVWYELLLQAPQMEVAAIPQELCTMRFVSNIQRISAKEMEELRKDLPRAAGDAGWGDGWRA